MGLSTKPRDYFFKTYKTLEEFKGESKARKQKERESNARAKRRRAAFKLIVGDKDTNN